VASGAVVASGIVFSDRPAKVQAQLTIDRPYARHRDDAYLVGLRREILGLLGLGGLSDRSQKQDQKQNTAAW